MRNTNNKPIRLLTGNHDLESQESKPGTQWTIKPKDPVNKCATTEFEMETCDDTNSNLTCKARSAEDTYYDLDQTTNTLFLYLNTTIYDEYPKNKHLKESEQCEAVWLKLLPQQPQTQQQPSSPTSVTTDLVSTVAQLSSNQIHANFQQTQIRQALTNTNTKGTPIHTVIIVGHHPIYGVKCKNDKPEFFPQHWNENGFNLLEMIIHHKYNDTTEEQPSFIYLCADIHHYQENNLTITTTNHPTGDAAQSQVTLIKQYIVGTGGASQDVPPGVGISSPTVYNKEKMPEFIKKYEIQYEVVASQQEFGLQLAQCHNHEWTFKFIPISPTKTGDGVALGGRRYSQRKHMMHAARRMKRLSKRRGGKTQKQKKQKRCSIRKRRSIRKNSYRSKYVSRQATTKRDWQRIKQ